jgi:hypothetical protein
MFLPFRHVRRMTSEIAMTRYRYRSAITGRYVSEAFAKRNPSTTVREKVS